MPTKVAFVVAIGRLSNGDMTALPKIQTIAAKHGGTVIPGGVGSSKDPIVAEFADGAEAAKAAQEAWYLDDIEFAKVLGADFPAAVAPVAPPEVKSQDNGPSQYPKNFGVQEAIQAVASGKPVAEAVDALLAPQIDEAQSETLTIHHGSAGLHASVVDHVKKVGGTVQSTIGGKSKVTVPAAQGKATEKVADDAGHHAVRGSVRED